MGETVRKDLETVGVKVDRLVAFISLYAKLERSSPPVTKKELEAKVLDEKAKQVLNSPKNQLCPNCGKELVISAGIKKPIKRSGIALRIHGNILCPDPECGYVGKYSRMVK